MANSRAMSSAAALGTAGLEVGALRVEYQRDPLGIDAPAPRLSWKLAASSRGVLQTAYQLRVAEDPGALERGESLSFDSGVVRSGQSTWIPYGGTALQSRSRYYWQVQVWDNHHRCSGWSQPAFWEMGLLREADWRARWVTPDLATDPFRKAPVPMLRTAFVVHGKVVRARAYVTALGLYELHLNGAQVGDQLFTPGWTSYAHRLQYQTYDVTGMLKQGPNAVGALLGDGWYRGTLGAVTHERCRFGERLALLAQLEISYEDGRTEIIVTDSSWRAAAGPIVAAELYDGEVYDARLERPGWTDANFDDHDWVAVQVLVPSVGALIATAGPPVRRIAALTPTRIVKTPRGVTVADMGQNMVGWVRLRVRGAAGTTITLRHAEILTGDGEIYSENLRAAQQTVQYTLKGIGEEVFEPHFTFQGFRYVAVEGYPGEIEPGNMTGVVIHSDMDPIGTFETSCPLIDQLQHNILWSQKGNFLDVPTDCPQRNERLGWTADAQIFCATAAFNMDVTGFFAKWLGDVAAEQTPAGAIPWVVPDVIHQFPMNRWQPKSTEMIEAAGAAGWSDAAVVIPWRLYLAYGDTGILRAQYPSMARWVEYQRQRAGDDFIWSDEFQFGDWLDFFSTAKSTYFGSTSTDLIATAYFAHSVDLLRRAAEVLGRNDDAARYAVLFANVSQAFHARYVTHNGQVGEGTQTAYVLALEFDLLPESMRPLAARHLAEDVRTRGHLTTGFLGTPHLLNVLSRFGYLDEAYRLLNRREFPSWLFPVTRGATTIWERWDGIRPDGSLQNPRMNSFNHYAYGAVGEWMYRVMAGLDVDAGAPGYAHSLVRPMPGGGLTHVSATLQTRYGMLSAAWEIAGGTFQLTAVIPANTRGTICLPRAAGQRVLEGEQPLTDGNGILGHSSQGDHVRVEVGSGRYCFSYPWRL
jgi:alpha-L-rhamnosidase